MKHAPSAVRAAELTDKRTLKQRAFAEKHQRAKQLLAEGLEPAVVAERLGTTTRTLADWRKQWKAEARS